MTPIVSTIPKLGKGQKVKEWRKSYIAAAALLTEKQQIDMLPMYGARNEAETLIAETCTNEATIVAALNELETLIDGPRTNLRKFNDFWDCKPDKKNNYHALISFYFVLKSEGTIAGISKEMIMKRYLNFIPGAEKIYDTHAALLVPEITDAQMTTIFKSIQQDMFK